MEDPFIFPFRGRDGTNFKRVYSSAVKIIVEY
jgi:hypothetical protein